MVSADFSLYQCISLFSLLLQQTDWYYRSRVCYTETILGPCMLLVHIDALSDGWVYDNSPQQISIPKKVPSYLCHDKNTPLLAHFICCMKMTVSQYLFQQSNCTEICNTHSSSTQESFLKLLHIVDWDIWTALDTNLCVYGF